MEGPSKTRKDRLSRDGPGRINLSSFRDTNGSGRQLQGELLPVRIRESTGFTFYGEPVIDEGEESKGSRVKGWRHVNL
jgi:hypothetical protein